MTRVLYSVKIDGSNLKISYSKNFDTCAHLMSKDTLGRFWLIHSQSFFCQGNQLGSKIEITQPLSAFFLPVSPFGPPKGGEKVKLCHGNNGNICSEEVAITIVSPPSPYTPPVVSIKVLTPNGGETFKVGDTIDLLRNNSSFASILMGIESGLANIASQIKEIMRQLER